MTQLTTKAATGLATAAILASVFTPAAFANTKVKVNHNGALSKNTVTVKNTKTSHTTQTNWAAIFNLTGIFQNTGNNSASFNTGSGDTSVDSGKATATVTNKTTTGDNVATDPSCGCSNGNVNVTEAHNGARSTNTVNVTNDSTTTVSQTNEAVVVNGTLVGQNTGNNNASFNTGAGDVSADSGDASATVTNTTTTGGNVLVP